MPKPLMAQTRPLSTGLLLTAASPPNELIVGSYTSGSSTYGFVSVITTNTWTYPLAAFQSTYTVESNGVNSNGSICGWYLASGYYHGFVALRRRVSKTSQESTAGAYGS